MPPDSKTIRSITSRASVGLVFGIFSFQVLLQCQAYQVSGTKMDTSFLIPLNGISGTFALEEQG